MELLCRAIADRHLLSFYYDGLPRAVIPAAHGLHRFTGVPSLRCYQVGGRSNSGSVPNWRMFSTYKIASCKILDDAFDTVPPEYKLNDAHLAHIHCQLQGM